MKFTRSHSLTVLAALLLLGLGFVAGRFFSPATSPHSISAKRVSSTPAATHPESIAAPTATTEAKAADVGNDWTSAWTRLAALPHSPAADKRMEEALEKLAESDPARALSLVASEPNRRRHTEWLCAALRGWATVDPEAAAAWLSTLPLNEREGAEGAVMDGAARNPAAAIALAQRLVLDDPTDARSHANHLLRVLSQIGEYESSVGFAVRLPESIRAEMLGTAFQYWAQAQPERAFDVARNLPAGDTRKAALDAAISGWAQENPSGLAEFALTLASTADRTEALQTAMREWVQINPKAASDWIDTFDAKPELDAGAAAVALQPDILAKHPDIAASWAESITDPQLRSSTLANVLRDWKSKDAAAAINYAKTSPALLSSDLAALLTESAAQPASP